MHPALSVIVFTVVSGAGYGLLALVGIGAAFGWLPMERGFALAAFGSGFALTTVGLLSSSLHLGHPERAWRAFSQWRTSWLSREGVAALATYAPSGLLALVWLITGEVGAPGRLLGVASTALALATLYCTAMIYASLPTVRQWHDGLVPVAYLILGPMSGALLLAIPVRAFGGATLGIDLLALGLIVAGGVVKLIYWKKIDGLSPALTPGEATGLGGFGRVRLLDPPNTEENYIQREMGFVIARKHARRLRRLALVIGFLVPALLMALACKLPGAVGLVAVILSASAALLGLLIERWLFFAEAKHTVMLYYGATGA
jgi:sulfite dehydrogenase (quinone) subunit SoeC